MRNILLAGAALAALGLSAPAAFAQVYDPGGPTRIGNACKVVTDLNGEMAAFGYYAPCPEQPAPAVIRAKKRPR